MEWNCWWSLNTVTPFLFESSGDSEEYLKSDHVHVADEAEGVLFRFDDEHDVDHVEDDGDDARSCSYDHSSYINTRSYDDDVDTSQHVKSKRLIHNDDDDHEDDDGDIDDGDDDNNHGESKLRDSSKRQKISHEFCGDNLLINQREIDRKFWEACLAS